MSTDAVVRYDLPVAEILPRSFYARDTATVARDLLGQRLVHLVDGRRLSGIIVETEAYLGSSDRACHSYGGRRTERVRSMYLAGGYAYVYFVYGMHFCFNVVTRTEAEPEAVLIRALEPEEGVEEQLARRGPRAKTSALANGPAKLCRALGIDRAHDGSALWQTPLFIERGRRGRLDPKEILVGSRIGIAYAGTDAARPLRFGLRGSAHLSRPF